MSIPVHGTTKKRKRRGDDAHSAIRHHPYREGERCAEHGVALTTTSIATPRGWAADSSAQSFRSEHGERGELVMEPRP